MTPLFGVAGWKNSGKTTLVARIIETMTARGYRVSSIKHAHHGFDIDKEGTDSFRHRHAGASEVAIISDRRWAMMHELRDEAEPTLQEITARLSPADIVIVEGFKREPHPKIELRRKEARNNEILASGDPTIVAVASDHATDTNGLPLFDIDDVEAIVDFIAAHLRLGEPATAP
ncbi:MAG: molybdopterin-guanine dinucleotide biosynthesis protein B [Rhodobiaceae bacterium]|nr:molybdopterin-guanine dinucleotide biosynthesis protein B [Rhodobiaceae bacterium]